MGNKSASFIKTWYVSLAHRNGSMHFVVVFTRSWFYSMNFHPSKSWSIYVPHTSIISPPMVISHTALCEDTENVMKSFQNKKHQKGVFKTQVIKAKERIEEAGIMHISHVRTHFKSIHPCHPFKSISDSWFAYVWLLHSIISLNCNHAALTS